MMFLSTNYFSCSFKISLINFGFPFPCVFFHCLCQQKIQTTLSFPALYCSTLSSLFLQDSINNFFSALQDRIVASDPFLNYYSSGSSLFFTISSKTVFAIFPEMVLFLIRLISFDKFFADTGESLISLPSLFKTPNNSTIIQFAASL